MQKQFFSQPSFEATEILDLLNERGLVTSDPDLAIHFLKTIGYYRLKPYFQHFLVNPKNTNNGFILGTQFIDVQNLYNFDRELRLLVVDALERIEVALRATLSNAMSNKYGAHWYLDAALFNSSGLHKSFLKEVTDHLNRSSEGFIHEYYSAYHTPEHPPSWMIIECLSFGAVSKAYSNIKDRKIRKEIGDVLGQFSETVKSWMKALTFTRNICAHHARLWNRFFINKPCQVNISYTPPYNASPFSMQAHIIIKLLNAISPGNHWKNRLFFHLEKHETLISFESMGFQKDWQNDPFWKL